ncbi:MarR family winged helix-turn-helix transcriptional regulator [Mycolicibacterium smegmatis]|uniref:MarR family winged helix-turn-helix transcriptional regulator n=1 Tax=Mycolicibacterium smegmatis TaxID=1772 RepID=UPI0005DA286A|nr:MarR family transcriptional regulator [Mycolicibacterium smegmatis]MCP2621886.1 MarR family transcriptional regulator [Mycolicibacterium smegmatis]MDF1903716.1 MarR family transcriptional regulator [Mycolicibacterium smegmatis]MDF1910281.1 MarR family transcriptional regulator [Mycolicibacterium smegmatis]MDF1919825.1 MarR family transcriptional regulator [Mycolicibacterium smegmatis]MDF1928607.1 MarR family transcriptional regulator [Mycolicibacterium smegmatis]
MKHLDARVASDLALAVIRFARQLRSQRSDSKVTLTQLSALSTLAKEGSMTPGALAVRERVRPPSMTRVLTSLAEQGLVVRTAHPADGRQVMVSASAEGVELVEAEQRASQEWLLTQLGKLDADQRQTLIAAADLMSAMVDEKV